ncbi:AraC family transcriptional regulator [Devriesea agamarum]|uniref:AraC family transcriptional regulator n=1 Tax=Devriesea agamarum TaxID=472569 RepID=UPI00155E3FC6|nr:helix-turn-helix transcriptional regulator [Devriesea agamarum]
MTAPAPFAAHPIFTVESRLEAEHLLGRILGPLSIAQPAGTSRHTPFSAHAHALDLPGIWCAHLDIQSPSHIDIPHWQAGYALVIPTSGFASVQVGSTKVKTSPLLGAVAHPGQRVLIDLKPPCPVRIVAIDAELVERVSARYTARTDHLPTMLETFFDLTRPDAMRWNAILSLLLAEAMTPASPLSQGRGVGALAEMLASSLVLAQDPSMRQIPTNSRTSLVRDAIELVECCIDTATPSLLARELHVSERTLQAAFRRELGVTPSRYVRNRRLDLIRSELLGRHPGHGVSVAAIARSYGLTHPGRFSSEYRARFGELPSHTLRLRSSRQLHRHGQQ